MESDVFGLFLLLVLGFWDLEYCFLDIWYGGIIFLKKLTGDDGRRDMPPLQSDKAIVSQTGSHVARVNKDRMIRLNIFKGLINYPIDIN